MRSAVAALDHLVLATPDIDATAAWIETRTGISPSPGGQHIGRGTRNALCSLGTGRYLEVIGPDPEQPAPATDRPFGLDDIVVPAVVAWAIAVPDIDAARASAMARGFDPGEPAAMQRSRPDGTMLNWRLTTSNSIAVPFLIDWDSLPHPSADAAPGLEIVDLRARHPDPVSLANALDALGVSIGIERGPEALLVELHGPLGSVGFE